MRARHGAYGLGGEGSANRMSQHLREGRPREVGLWFIGTAGFEPATPATPLQCATGLRHVPFSRSEGNCSPEGWRTVGSAARGPVVPRISARTSVHKLIVIDRSRIPRPPAPHQSLALVDNSRSG